MHHGAGDNNVDPEGMKHMGQALQTNRTVTHVEIGCELLCIVCSGNAGVCEGANTCAWRRCQWSGFRGHEASGAGLANESHRDARDDCMLVVVYCT